MKNFKDKVVVVTGAGSGMGRAYALKFSRLGSRLAICDYDERGLKETAELIIQQSGATPLSQKVDVSKKDAVYSFASKVKESFGNAHIVINNAGISGEGKPTWDLPDTSIERVMAINFWGVVYGTRAFLPQLLENGAGAIVNVSSIFGLVGTPNNSDYCASKFAVRGFTESLAVELSSSRIQVHLVHPGGVATNIDANSEDSKFADQYLTTSPDDIADIVYRKLLKNEPRIVCGNNASLVWFCARFIPFKYLRNWLWSSMKSTLNLQNYKVLKK